MRATCTEGPQRRDRLPLRGGRGAIFLYETPSKPPFSSLPLPAARQILTELGIARQFCTRCCDVSPSVLRFSSLRTSNKTEPTCIASVFPSLLLVGTLFHFAPVTCFYCDMGGPAAVHSGGGSQHYAHLVDNSRPWWKNRRLVSLNLWILLLCVAVLSVEVIED